MRISPFILLSLLILGCNDQKQKTFTEVEITDLMTDTVSIRAITLMNNNLGFAGSNGFFGIYNQSQNNINKNIQSFDTIQPAFRAVAATSTDFFMLSIGNPALLYKTGDDGKMQLVYTEENKKVFYDAMHFWNDQEGIAMGDPTENCLSVIITRDGGETWNKLNCNILPKTAEGEAAFAASNSNIAIVGEETWLVSGGMKSRVFYSPDKGLSWQVTDTPIVQGSPTQGIYSVAFYDAKNGFVVGGDYTDADANSANKAITINGGKSWKLVADGSGIGYKSCVQYVPHGKAKKLVAVGFTGISYSENAGKSWTTLSEEGFYTIRFLNDSTAYAAGKNRLAKLIFR
jgi:photosystem II stability/assembly factor-like uncharacterized protein